MDTDVPLIVSSKPMIRRWLYGSAVLVPFWLGAVAYALMHRPVGTQAEQSLYGFARAMAQGVPLLLLMNGILLTAAAEWTLSDDEIVRRPILGRVRRIQWKDVRRIHWSSALVELRSDNETIAVNNSSLPAAQRTAVIERLKAQLAPHFDLSRRPLRRPAGADTVRSWATILTITVPWSSVLVWLTVRYPLWYGTTVAIGVSIFASVPLSLLMIYGESRDPRNTAAWRERVG